MTNTLIYLRQFVTPDMLSSTEDDLATSYRLTKDDRLIAALFIKLLPVTEPIVNKYTSVEKETAISFILTMIEDIANNFDGSKKTKFKTDYITSLKRLMYGLLETALRKKRVCPTELKSIDERVFNNDESSEIIKDMLADNSWDEHRRDLELYDLISRVFDPLTSKIFICLAQGYSRSETANLLNINSRVLSSIIKENKSILSAILK